MSTDLELQLLSSAPWFDEDTAVDLMTLKGDPSDSGRLLLNRIRRSGVLVTRAGLQRVAEPLRTEMRKNLHEVDASLYRGAIRVFLKHARSGMRGQLQQVLGNQGATANLEVLTFIAEPDSKDESLRELIRFVRSQDHRTEAHSAQNIADLLRTYQLRGDRSSDFFQGMSLWTSGKKVESINLLEQVIAGSNTDRMGAIAGHLLGVYYYSEGRLPVARSIVQASASALRALGDDWGLVMTLNTLSRVERELFRANRDPGYIEAAIEAGEEAVRLAPLDGRSAQALTSVYAEAERFADALSSGHRAAELLSSGEDGVSARLTLALAYRGSGDEENFLHWVQEAASLAEDDNVGGKLLARTLNIAASAERRRFNLDAAERNARRSLHLGRQLGDMRHVAHAGHTLASILIDLAAKDAQRYDAMNEARALLIDSREALVQLRDARGIGMVDETLNRIPDHAANELWPDQYGFRRAAELASDNDDPPRGASGATSGY